MNPEIVQTQSWRYKTIAVIKRQQQTTMSNKIPAENKRTQLCLQTKLVEQITITSLTEVTALR